MKKFLFHFFFVLIAVGVLVGQYSNNSQIDHLFKPFILIWIAAYFFAHIKNKDKAVLKLAGFGFLFSWSGDIFMMFSSEYLFFILGIVSFLIAQILYAFLFLRTITLSVKKPFLKKKPIWLIPFIVFGLLVFILLFEHLDSVLLFAIFIYIIGILFMSSMALNRYGNGHPISFSLVFSGSLFFVVSDTLIAVNRFLVTTPYAGLFVMATYIAAQFLIMKGILKQYE